MKRLFLALCILLLTSCGEEPVSVPNPVAGRDRPARPVPTEMETIVYTRYDGGALFTSPLPDSGPQPQDAGQLDSGTEDPTVSLDAGLDSGLVDQCEEDHDKGHGNDCDEVDSDNPGLQHRPLKKKKK